MSHPDVSQNVNDMFAVGAHFGYSKTRRHPSTAKLIFTTKNKVDIINLEKTEEALAKAAEFVKGLSAKGKVVLFVGVKPEAKGAVLAGAQSVDMPYVTERWVGGVLTNWPEIKKRIARLVDLKEKKEAGELDKYTKKERLLIDEEVAKMHKLFSGLVGMKKTPDAVFVVDAKREHIAVTEAHKMGVPVIALTNTDTDIRTIEYPVVGNDGSVSSITYFVNKIVEAYKEGHSVKA